MKKFVFIFFCGLICAATMNAQTWQIGSPNAGDVTATLSGPWDDRTLTISGTGTMQNYDRIQDGSRTNAPWHP